MTRKTASIRDRITNPSPIPDLPLIGEGSPEAGVYPDDIRVPLIRLLGPRLLVLPAQAVAYQTNTGIVVPVHAQDHAQKGVVLVVGEGTLLQDGTRLPPKVEVGEEIVYARYGGTEITLERDTFLIIQESDVRAILTYRGKVFATTPPGESASVEAPSSS